MTTSLNQGSATIYQFPVGGRAALAGRRYGEANPAVAQASRVSEAVISGSWYHQAAIEEASAAVEH